MKALREEDGIASGEENDKDDEAGWEGWDVESDSSEDSSESGGWIDVHSDGDDDLDISDSDDEGEKSKNKGKGRDKADAEASTPGEEPITRISSLATTKVNLRGQFSHTVSDHPVHRSSRQQTLR